MQCLSLSSHPHPWLIFSLRGSLPTLRLWFLGFQVLEGGGTQLTVESLSLAHGTMPQSWETSKKELDGSLKELGKLVNISWLVGVPLFLIQWCSCQRQTRYQCSVKFIAVCWKLLL